MTPRQRGRRFSDYRVDTFARIIYWFVNSSIVFNSYTTPHGVAAQSVEISILGIGVMAILAAFTFVGIMDVGVNDIASASWKIPFAFRTRPWIYWLTCALEAAIVFIPVKDGLDITFGQIYYYSGLVLIGLFLALHSAYVRHDYELCVH